MTYKNFTVLSQALGFSKPPEGNSRKAVMSALAEQYELSKDGRQITVVAKKERKNEEFNILGCPGNLLGQMKNFVKYYCIQQYP